MYIQCRVFDAKNFIDAYEDFLKALAFYKLPSSLRALMFEINVDIMVDTLTDVISIRDSMILKID